jgi:ubiquinone/menaquinone biosynthesis C-methylase UbiE
MQGLEPWFQELRIHKVWPHIPEGSTLVDFGCDREQTLVRRIGPLMKKVIGLDLVCRPQKRGNTQIMKADLEKKLPLHANSADVITMLAVLEHLPHPDRAVTEAHRILKKGGVFLITVPSPKTKKLLPWLAKLKIVRQEMIDQHHNYFTYPQLRRLLKQAGFKRLTVESWELGCNTFVKAVK